MQLATIFVECWLGNLERAQLWFGTFGYDHQRRIPTTIVTLGHDGRNFTNVKRHFWHQDRRRSAGETGVQGDPACVATHDLDHHDAVVALCRGVQTVDGIGGDLHSGLETERGVGTNHVVVDGLGHADDRQAVVVSEHRSDGQRTIAADDD